MMERVAGEKAGVGGEGRVKEARSPKKTKCKEDPTKRH